MKILVAYETWGNAGILTRGTLAGVNNGKNNAERTT